MPTKWMCAWCEMEFGEMDASQAAPDKISHGICPVCYDIQMKEVSDLTML